MLAHIRSASFDGCRIFSSDGSWKSLEKADSKILCYAQDQGGNKEERREQAGAALAAKPGEGVRHTAGPVSSQMGERIWSPPSRSWQSNTLRSWLEWSFV